MGNGPFDEDENEDEGNLVNKLRKANKAKEKELEELRTQVAKLAEQSQRGDVSSFLAEQGFDPRYAKFYPKDQPTTADAVAEWVAENSDLLGAPNRRTPEPQTTTLSEDAQRGLEIYRQMSEADSAVTQDLDSRLRNAKNPEELMAVLKGFAAPPGMH